MNVSQQNTDLKAPAALPQVPCAYTFLISGAYRVEKQIVAQFNELRASNDLFDRVLALALLNELACYEDSEAAADAAQAGRDPGLLTCAWLEKFFSEQPSTKRFLEYKWMEKAAGLLLALEELTELVSKENDQDKLWAAGIQILRTRDDLQRVASTLGVFDLTAWNAAVNHLDDKCTQHNSIWTMIEPRDDSRIRSAALSNSSVESPWWLVPVSNSGYDPATGKFEFSEEGFDFCEDNDPALFDGEDGHHFWLCLFRRSGENNEHESVFSQYIGETQTMATDARVNALVSLGKILPENLTCNGHQVLTTDTNGEVVSIASLTPFQVRDAFTFMNGVEHADTYGAAHYEELAAILRLKVSDQIENWRLQRVFAQQALDSDPEILELMCGNGTDEWHPLTEDLTTIADILRDCRSRRAASDSDRLLQVGNFSQPLFLQARPRFLAWTRQNPPDFMGQHTGNMLPLSIPKAGIGIIGDLLSDEQGAQASELLRGFVEKYGPLKPPPIDALMDVYTAPIWLKSIIRMAFEEDDPYKQAAAVGFLARIGTDEVRQRAAEWAATIPVTTCEKLAQSCMKHLSELPKRLEPLGELNNDIEREPVVAYALWDRDGIASCMWVLNASQQPVELTTDEIDAELRKCQALSETILDPNYMPSNILAYAKARIKGCWWLEAANV